VAGLERRRLGPLAVFAQSVSGAAPSAAMAATPAIVAATAGGGTVWSFVIATGLALLIASCIARFTRRMAATGGVYSLTAKGLGPAAAFAAALASLVGYGLLAAAALAGVALYLDALVGEVVGRGVGASVGSLGHVLIVLVAGLSVGVLVVRGVRLSARVVLLAESCSIALMLVVFTSLIAGGMPGGAPVAMPGPGPGGIVVGVLPALAAFIGFEIATLLGAEARTPFRSVPRAVTLTAALTGVLYVFAAQVQVLGFATTPGGLAGQAEPVIALAAAKGWGWIPALLDVGLVMSFFACALATSTALARVVFSLARDGVVPATLGRTHRRFRTPHVAIAAALPVVVGVLVVALVVRVPLGTVLVGVLTAATCGFLLAYLLVCAAAPVFLHRIGELTTAAVVVSAVIVPILAIVLVAFVVTTPSASGLLVGVAAVGVAGYLWLRVRRADALAAIGVYDETTAADVLVPPRSRSA
jgi:amino acid transporter